MDVKVGMDGEAKKVLSNLRNKQQIGSDRVTIKDLETIHTASINEQKLVISLDRKLSDLGFAQKSGAAFVAWHRKQGVLPQGNITVGDLSTISDALKELKEAPKDEATASEFFGTVKALNPEIDLFRGVYVRTSESI
jgi:hypothetical protein